MPREMREDGNYRPGPLQKDVNVRSVVAAMNVGMGSWQFEKLLAIMELPTLCHRVFGCIEKQVCEVLEAVGNVSRARPIGREEASL